MKKLFLYTLAGALLYSASTWAMELKDEREDSAQPGLPISQVYKALHTGEVLPLPDGQSVKIVPAHVQQDPIDAHILGRTDLPFSLALEAFDTGKTILLPGGQALKLDRSSVSRGRQHIPSYVLFHASDAHWYDYCGKTWLHISYTSHGNPHWALKFTVPAIPAEEIYWNRETVLKGTDFMERQIDFEFELISSPSTEVSCLSLRSSVVTPWLCIPSEDVIPLKEHANLLQTGALFPIPEGYVRLIKTGASLSPIKDWGYFVTTSEHPILQSITPLLEQGWHFSSYAKPSGYFADIFRTSGGEDPHREIKESMLALARKGKWVVLTVSGFLISSQKSRSSAKPVKPYTLLLEFFPSMEYMAQANDYRLTGKRIFSDDKKVVSAGLSTELEALFSGDRDQKVERAETAPAVADDQGA